MKTLIWKLFQTSLFIANTAQVRSPSADGGFSFSGSIQEVIKFYE